MKIYLKVPIFKFKKKYNKQLTCLLQPATGLYTGNLFLNLVRL